MQDRKFVKRRWAPSPPRGRTREAMIAWLLVLLPVIAGCTTLPKPEASYTIPDSLLTCRVPNKFINPAVATQADAGNALVDIYDAWADCYDTVERARMMAGN